VPCILGAGACAEVSSAGLEAEMADMDNSLRLPEASLAGRSTTHG
jgi:hypothetical protein